jgi:hypothetical protein
VTAEHGDDHRSSVDPGTDATWHRQVGLDTSDWISSRIGRVPSSAQATLLISPAWVREQTRGVGHLQDSRVNHLEAADFIGRAEPVLRRTHHPKPGVAVTLKCEHDIDQML